MKKITSKYMDFYYKHPSLFRKMDIVNVMLSSYLLLGLILNKEWAALGFFIWIWGLRVSSLFLKR